MNTCANCGSPLVPGATFCTSCGTRTEGLSEAQGGADTVPPPGTPAPPPPAGYPPPGEPTQAAAASWDAPYPDPGATSAMAPVPPDATQAYGMVEPGPYQPLGGYPPPPGGPGGPGMPPYGGPPPPERKDNKALWLIPLILLLVGGLVAGGLFLANRDDDEAGGGDGETASEILLEPSSMRLAQAFVDSIELPGASITEVPRPEVPSNLGQLAAAHAARPAQGDEPGLYGGTRDQGTCDPEQLIEFLEGNEAKAEAWADVVGIEADEIREYVEELTPVVLRRDTFVTNHGFTNGEANPIPSILQAGTAVMVDRHGVPRVKCNCGNPLAPPPEVEDVTYEGDEWDGFDPDEVTYIDVDVDIDIDQFILVDNDSGDLFARPFGTNGEEDADIPEDLCSEFVNDPGCSEEATTSTTSTTSTTEQGSTTTEPVLGTGDVQVTLRWDSIVDLDLAVTDPLGEALNFSFTGPSSSGGNLDVDANVSCDDSTPVENIFWPEGAAPAGEYTVEVTFYGDCGVGATSSEDFELTILVDGESRTETGTLSTTQPSATFNFTV